MTIIAGKNNNIVSETGRKLPVANSMQPLVEHNIRYVIPYYPQSIMLYRFFMGDFTQKHKKKLFYLNVYCQCCAWARERKQTVR